MRALPDSRRALPHSGIREVVNEALRRPGCIRLEVGEPNFATPEHIVQAAYEAARQGATKYTATAGLLSLREAICAKLRAVNGITANVEQINVSAGGVNGIAAALTALLERGDEALIPDPAWPNYAMQAEIAGATVVRYPLQPQRGFQPDPGDIEPLITPRTKALVINSPCNPTGAVFSRETVAALLDLAQRHDLYLVADECYDQLVYEGAHISPAALCLDERIISCFTFSKTYAMTGWRVGYVVAAAPLADVITRILEANVSCAAMPAQRAAEAALLGPQQCVEEMAAAYDSRRRRVCAYLSAHGLLGYVPQGAFYVMVDVSRSGMKARDFAFGLLRQHGVAVAPGTAFGSSDSAQRHVRVSLASAQSDLDEGLARLHRYVMEHSATPAGSA